MITDEMLKQAAKEAGNIIADSLLPQEEYSHVFSEVFENNMENVLQKAKRKKRNRVFRQAACWFAIFVVASSSFLMFNTEARATFLYWLKGQYKGYMDRNIVIQAMVLLNRRRMFLLIFQKAIMKKKHHKRKE